MLPSCSNKLEAVKKSYYMIPGSNRLVRVEEEKENENKTCVITTKSKKMNKISLLFVDVFTYLFFIGHLKMDMLSFSFIGLSLVDCRNNA